MLRPEMTIDRERVELESKVLAAAMRQSVDLGDAHGADFAHKALFYLLRSHQASAAYRLMARPVFQPIAKHEGNGGNGSNGGEHFDHQNGGTEHGNGHSTPVPNKPYAITTEVSKDYLPNLAKLFSDDVDSDEPEGQSTGWQRPAPPETIQNKAKARPTKPAPAPNAPAPAAAPAAQAPAPPAKPKVEREYVITPEMEKFLETVGAAKDVYGLLGVSQYASYELIHKSFLKRLRKLLLIRSKGGYQRRVLDQLRSLWIAHDILVDPKTRNDYDFRVMGLRGQSDSTGSDGSERSGGSQSQASLKIGELMQASGLLEATELEIACDMHKAMPEMQFGRFLVKQGFIEEYQLQAVLLGQRLIRDGKLTVAQFQELMSSVKDSVEDFKAAALEKAFVTKVDITKAEEEEEEAVAIKILSSLPPKTSARNIAAFDLPSLGKMIGDEGEAPQPMAESTAVDAVQSEISQTDSPELTEPVPASTEEASPPEAPTASTEAEPTPLATEAVPPAAAIPPAAKTSISKQKSEIKITNARLLSLLEEHERNANSPSDHDQGVFSRDNQLLTEIDLIDESEIEPDMTRSNPAPGDPNKKRKPK